MERRYVIPSVLVEAAILIACAVVLRGTHGVSRVLSMFGSIARLTNTYSGRFLRRRSRLQAALGREGVRVIDQIDIQELARLHSWIVRP